MAEPRIDLSGTRILVTGGGGGLGRGMALAFASWGASVGVADVVLSAAQETASRLTGNTAPVWVGSMDVTDEHDVQKALGGCWSALGGIDLLVNNAGLLSVAPVVDLTLSEWRRIVDVNLTGAFLVSRAVVRRMIMEKRPGSIVSIASIGGKRGDANIAHYNASKFGVIGFTQALAQEVAAHDILVNAVCPGVVETPMILEYAGGKNGEVGAWIEKQAIKRSQRPDEIAYAVAFLHTCRSVTGQALNIDGGTLFY
jgi:meso-butanediol dehydrogenase / (S,S)-butanediol dehydrogenase / diacetyl reductase